MPVDFSEIEGITKLKLVALIVLIIGAALWYREIYEQVTYVVPYVFNNTTKVLMGFADFLKHLVGMAAFIALIVLVVITLLEWQDRREGF